MWKGHKKKEVFIQVSCPVQEGEQVRLNLCSELEYYIWERDLQRKWEKHILSRIFLRNTKLALTWIAGDWACVQQVMFEEQ